MSTAELPPPVMATDAPPRIDATSAGLRMTCEEFDAIEDYDDLWRYELVGGVLVVLSIPLEAQADPNEQLGYLLNHHKQTHPNGHHLDKTLSERFIHLPRSRRIADRVIWCGLGRRPKPNKDVPQIAVEFVSAGKRNWIRDYEEKRDEYAAAGVVEYWLIDRFRRTMTVFRAGGEGPQEILVGENDVYQTDLLPGFELRLARILAVADEWEDES
ncbi:MAG: Uma2 family endonuclease [Planctomycetes bacterium]|nr:Uma2 family endonuclease [Planctomycetota bacterium]